MVTRIADGIWWLDLGNVNAYLVDTPEGPVAVDSGMPAHAERIREGMREAGLAPSDLHAVLVTHTDLDHVGGLAKLVEGTEATIHLSQISGDLLTGERSPPWLSTKGLFQRMTNPWVDRPDADRFHVVEDGEEIGPFTAIETPGHALGHMAYVHVDERVCFIGDLVRAEGEVTVPPRVINYDTGEIQESLAHLLETAPGFETVCAGHGEPVRKEGYAELKRLLG